MPEEVMKMKVLTFALTTETKYLLGKYDSLVMTECEVFRMIKTISMTTDLHEYIKNVFGNVSGFVRQCLIEYEEHANVFVDIGMRLFSSFSELCRFAIVLKLHRLKTLKDIEKFKIEINKAYKCSRTKKSKNKKEILLKELNEKIEEKDEKDGYQSISDDLPDCLKGKILIPLENPNSIRESK